MRTTATRHLCHKNEFKVLCLATNKQFRKLRGTERRRVDPEQCANDRAPAAAVQIIHRDSRAMHRASGRNMFLYLGTISLHWLLVACFVL